MGVAEEKGRVKWMYILHIRFIIANIDVVWGKKFLVTGAIGRSQGGTLIDR